jgi:hypothetical protein
MKENPSILAELRDLISEVSNCLKEEDHETAIAFVEQFILLENDGAFSAQSKVLSSPVWDVSAPSDSLSADKISERARMKAYTDPDFGAGAVMMLMANTGASLKESPAAVMAYLEVGNFLTVRKDEKVLQVALHTSSETLRGGANATVSVGLTLSEKHHGELIALPSEPFMAMVTAEWIAIIPAEKERFSLKTFDGGQLIEY